MKKEITVLTCDRCGCEYKDCGSEWHTVWTDPGYAFIGIKAMYSNCGVGSKYDLCRKCTLEIAKQFVEKMENER